MTELASRTTTAPSSDCDTTTLRQWNWGAFTFSWIWALGMRLWVLGLLFLLVNIASINLAASSKRNIIILIVLVNLAANVCLGWLGNRLAWKSRTWKSLLNFKVTQMAWEKYARPLAITVLTLVPMYYLLSMFKI